MKKRIYFGLFVIVMAVIGALAFTACTESGGVYSYEDAHLYNTAPEVSEGETVDGMTVDTGITALDIEWVSGKVEVLYTDTDKVVFNEKIEEFDIGADSDYLMRYCIQEGTLRIRFAKSGVELEKGKLDDKDKTLYVYIPKGEGSTILNRVEIKATTAKVVVNKIAAKELTVENESGVTQIKDVCIDDEINVKSVSGSQKTANSTTKKLTMESISGYFEVLSNRTDRIRVNSVSGYITLNRNEAKNVEIDAASCRVDVEYPINAEEIDIETSSGNVNIKFGEEVPSFEAILKTDSGRIDADPGIREENGTYLYGVSGATEDNRLKIVVKSGSGNLSIGQEKTSIGLTK